MNLPIVGATPEQMTAVVIGWLIFAAILSLVAALSMLPNGSGVVRWLIVAGVAVVVCLFGALIHNVFIAPHEDFSGSAIRQAASEGYGVKVLAVSGGRVTFEDRYGVVRECSVKVLRKDDEPLVAGRTVPALLCGNVAYMDTGYELTDDVGHRLSWHTQVEFWPPRGTGWAWPVLRQVLNDGSFPFSDIPISGSCLCCVDAESEVEKWSPKFWSSFRRSTRLKTST